MALEIEGVLIEKLPPVSGTSKAGKEWEKCEFIIETQDQFPKKVCFTLFGDKVSLINDTKIGQSINVAFNLESREFNGKYYHNINCWRIDQLTEPSTPEFTYSQVSGTTTSEGDGNDDDSNDLPF